MSDRILLQGLAFYGYHGVRPEETSLGQHFIVDVEILADLRGAGESDDITQTVDYTSVYQSVRAIVEGPPLRLIETVAERIAAVILTREGVASVRVRVRKPDVPIAGTLEYVGVEIERGLEDPVAVPGESSASSASSASSEPSEPFVDEAPPPDDESWRWDQATRAYLSLGSNLGDRLDHLVGAVRALSAASQVTTVSPIYESEALGPDGQPMAQPAYLNCVVAIDTMLTARDLLAMCTSIERSQGRNNGQRWQPRSIDVDLVLYGDARIDTPELTVPHPRMHERAFVLRPLVNIDPAIAMNGVGALALLLPAVEHQPMRLHTTAAAFAVMIEGAT